MVTERLQDLTAIEAALWRELDIAVHEPGHAWRVSVLATHHHEGADARCVVLRELDRANRTLLTYTDARSPKVHQVGNKPRGTLVLWSPALGWQLRLRVRLTLHTEGLMVSSRWAKLKMTPGAQDYLSPLPPGSPLDQPAPPREDRGNFAVLAMEATEIDWLELHAEGHRRAHFGPQGARWLAP